jgi:membrane protein YqaA with SNARE-associated domain
MHELVSLFIISFLSSTLLPGGSEAYLSWLILNTNTTVVIILFVATTGNTLGGYTNWLIGYFINSSLLSKFKDENREKNKRYKIAEKWIKKWGYTILLLSWLPLIGDLLCLLAGIYQLNVYKSIIYIFTGKFIRYTVLIYIIQELKL